MREQLGKCLRVGLFFAVGEVDTLSFVPRYVRIKFRGSASAAVRKWRWVSELQNKRREKTETDSAVAAAANCRCQKL